MPMTWDPVWERIFRSREQWGYYPPEELIRFMARHYYQVADRSRVRVLEVGCGPGAGPAWYVAREGFSYTGIDGSATAIDKARRRFSAEGLAGEFVVGSGESLPWADGAFDCVIDVACLQHNDEAAARAMIGEIHRVLIPGGRHFSLTTRAGCWGDGTGAKVDSSSYRDVSEGPFAGMGVVRFSTKEQLRQLYVPFAELQLEYSVRSLDGEQHLISNWILTCRK
jgi:SAM-dependent methyltransferase